MTWRVFFFVGLTVGVFADDVTRAIEGLGARKYADREAAQVRLVDLAAADPEPLLQRAVREFATTRDPEVRERLRTVMQAVLDRHVWGRPQGFLGIRMAPALVVLGGAAPALKSQIQVVGLTEDSAAQKAGLQVGDVITGLDGQPLAADAPQQAFTENIRARPPGTVVRLRVMRDGEEQEISVTLGAMPAEVQAELFPPERKRVLFEEWLRRSVSGLPAAGEQKIDKPERAR